VYGSPSFPETDLENRKQELTLSPTLPSVCALKISAVLPHASKA
jgi:hypothetical protein